MRQYIKGAEAIKRQLPEDFFGTWTVVNTSDKAFEWKGTAVDEVTVTDDVKLQIGGEELDMFFEKYDEELYWETTEKDLNGWFRFPSDKDHSFLLIINGTGNSCLRDVETVEMTVDNWQKYLHTEVRYAAAKDEFGDFRYMYTILALVPNEEVVDGDVLVEVTYKPSGFAVVTYDQESGKLTAREMTKEEETTFAGYIEGRSDSSTKTTRRLAKQKYADEPEARLQVLLGSVGVCKLDTEGVTVDGSKITGPQIASFDVSVSRIKGQVYIRK